MSHDLATQNEAGCTEDTPNLKSVRTGLKTPKKWRAQFCRMCDSGERWLLYYWFRFDLQVDFSTFLTAEVFGKDGKVGSLRSCCLVRPCGAGVPGYETSLRARLATWTPAPQSHPQMRGGPGWEFGQRQGQKSLEKLVLNPKSESLCHALYTRDTLTLSFVSLQPSISPFQWSFPLLNNFLTTYNSNELAFHVFIIKRHVSAIISCLFNWLRPMRDTLVFVFFFWQRWVFVGACGLSLVAASGGYSSLRCAGFSLRWLLLLRSTGSRRAGFSRCGTWAQ